MPITNALSAADIQRHGMAAIAESLKRGPVHIIEHNRPTAVVLTEEDYERLLAFREDKGGADIAPMTPAQSDALHYLLDLPPGNRSPEAIRADIERERASWE